MARWVLVFPLLVLVMAAPARAVVSAGCSLFGANTTYTALQNWPFDVIRLQVPWRPFCGNFSCASLPALIGANVRVTGNLITVDMFGSDDALPTSVLITRPPLSSAQAPVSIDVGPLAAGTYSVQATANGVTGGVISDLCRGPLPVMSVTIEKAAGPVVRQTAVEFYNGTRDHYFMSTDPLEIAALDSGVQPGWARTGKSFAAFAPGKSGGLGTPVCRFYGSPAAGLDSHFYTANSSECTALPGLFGGAWKIETINAFEVRKPISGVDCPSGFVAIYRFWNRRSDSNHRYTTDPTVAAEMRKRGWGEEESAMCSPP